MGSSATACIAWGVDFGDEGAGDAFDWEGAGTDQHEFGDDVMPGLLGFTEQAPERPDGLDGEGHRRWFEEVRKPYNERFAAAVPLEFESWGYEYGGSALVLRRSLTRADWDCVPVDGATLAAPTAAEMAAFRTVLDHLGHNGEVKLLLMARYG